MGGPAIDKRLPFVLVVGCEQIEVVTDKPQATSRQAPRQAAVNRVFLFQWERDAGIVAHKMTNAVDVPVVELQFPRVLCCSLIHGHRD